MFFDIQELIRKAKKIYEQGDIFVAYIQNANIFPFSINLKNIKESDIKNDYTKVIQSIKKLENSGLPVVYKEFAFKSLGSQRLPIKIEFSDLNEYLKTFQIIDDYDTFITLYNRIIAQYPSLKTLFVKKPFLVLEYCDEWDRILAVVDFLLQNKHPNIYIRELNILNTDTKFVEKQKKIIDLVCSSIQEIEPLSSLNNEAFEKKYHLKYQEPQVRFRILDSDLYIAGLSDISLPLSDFKLLDIECKKIFIIENKITTLSFPPIKNGIVIFGQGYGVSILRNILWLESKEIYYWGDIDTDGFTILSQLKGYYPNAKSFLMDERTIQKYNHLKVEAKIELKQKDLPNLIEEERLIYERLLNDLYGRNFRLEQERIPFWYAQTILGEDKNDC